MAYTRVYPTRINWENAPSIKTPMNATNLNAIDYAVYTHDQTLVNWDTTKANESDLLLSVKSVDYDTETGVFVFTWQNGTTKTVDLNIEKIPVSFSMSPAGVITMTTEDGSTYTADVGALIKTYTFTDSSVIDFTVTTDSDGNKTVTADIVDGSITGTKLQPNYLADCQSAKTDAETAEGLAEDSAEDSEAWANGTRNGVPVTSSDPAYHNNSKYWSEQSNPTSLVGLTDTDIDNPTNGQTLIYNSTSQKWENNDGGSASLAGLSDVDLTTPTDGQVLTYDSVNQEWVNADIGASGGSNITVTTTEVTLHGQNVTITDGVTTLTETFSPSGVALFEGVTMTGQLTIASGAFSTTVNVPYFGNYNPILSGFTATITVTFPADSTCTCTKSGETQTAYVSPHTFYVHSAGTYTITATDGTHTKSDTVTITTDGQSESVTLTYVPDGSTVLPTDDIQIWLNCADIYDKTTYTTLSDVLSDSTTLSTLINDNNAVDYMVRSKSWCGIGLVPKMTSNTTPSGVCSGTNMLSGYDYYYAFNDDYTLTFNSTSGGIIQYQFPSPVMLGSYTISPMSDAQYASRFPNTSKCDVFTNGSDWTEISNVTLPYTQGSTTRVSAISSEPISYVRLTLSGTKGGTSYTQCHNIQFYSENICDNSTAMTYIGLNNYASNTLLADSDWLNAICNSAYFESVLNVKVPTMTSNTTPSGTCIGSSIYGSTFDYYKAFDGDDGTTAWASGDGNWNNSTLGYDFGTNVIIHSIKMTNRKTGTLDIYVGNFTVQGWNGSSWVDIQNCSNTNTGDGAVTNYNITNNTAYSKFQIKITSRIGGTSAGTYVSVGELQFYGRVEV